ncbi:hypothetical protein HMPREF9080_01457, partial [Cardiobacterium valvarum F0432]
PLPACGHLPPQAGEGFSPSLRNRLRTWCLSRLAAGGESRFYPAWRFFIPAVIR